jgi:2-succinyl-5-enolpyruvyl-6-hydroxy-3-cyclohexene-1-carboxylate synthase
LVDQWVQWGLRHAVVSPGSRSTPLALAVAADDRVSVSVHHDERSAAFMALGIGAASGVPAMVVTTSGTAAVELHPAVVEAHHAGVPLLVCTADRPEWLHGVGAPQTIDQTNLYGSSVRLFCEPGVPALSSAALWRPLADSAMAAATGHRPGPVHLNLAFDEPLVGTPLDLPDSESVGTTGAANALGHAAASVAASVGAGMGGGAGMGVGAGMGGGAQGAVAEPIDATVVASVAASVTGRRGVIVAGGAIADPQGVMALAAVLGWPVLADPRSGCRVRSPVVVAHPDALLRHDGTARALAPEVVLRLGTPWASKVLGQWLDSLDAHQIGVHAHGMRFDPGGSLDDLVEAEPGALCSAVASVIGGTSSTPVGAGRPTPWLDSWVEADQLVADVMATHLDTGAEVSEPSVARTVASVVPDGGRLVVSSSMPVRDLEWYAAPRTGLTVMANRGANGIDGVISTAVGVALARPAPVAVLVGDVATLHDSNALLGLAGRNVDLTVVVVDNDGGGIFSFLPQATALPAATFEELFGTPHGVDLVALAAAHGLSAIEVVDMASLKAAVTGSVGHRGTAVIVVRTSRSTNVEVHQRLHDEVVARLADRWDPIADPSTGG